MTASFATAAPRPRPKFLPEHPLLLIGGVLVAAQVALAFLAPLIAPYDPTAQSVLDRLQGPSLSFWLGTDQFGRDTLSRILWGYRASFLISLGSVVLALGLGGSLGVIAAYYRGWTERVIMRIMDLIFAFPIILLAIGIISILGPQAWTTAIAIGIVYVPTFARLLRGPALVIAESEFVLAARSLGAGDGRILLVHIVPNLASVILVQASLSLSTAILVEASLSFLGIGTQPPTPSLGLMLSEGRSFLLLSPWTTVFSGFAILLASFGFNLLGDALRDSLDPRLRGAP
ncbi:MAG: ABC transporter permease [Proteobacteria bacterium]|nr:ABC transporter permease [Pseudomonadota bacterium]